MREFVLAVLVGLTKVLLLIPKIFMWLCFGVAAVIFFPFTILTSRRPRV